MSTEYLSSSTIRWMPCTCPSMRRSLPSALAFVSASIIVGVASCMGDVSRGLPLHEHPPDPVPGQRGGQMLEGVTADDGAHYWDIPYRGTLPRLSRTGPWDSGREVGKERRLGRGGACRRGRRARPTRAGSVAALGSRLPALALGPDPAFLAGDFLPLLDHREVHEPGQRMGQELQVLHPVARRVGPRLHLLGRQREGDTITLPGGQLELTDDGGPARPGGPRHEAPSSQRDVRVAWTIDLSLATHTHRAVSDGSQDGNRWLPLAGVGISGNKMPETVT